MPAVQISVALCTYNGADYLPAQLESILGQSQQPNEIVVCDDGSADATRSLVEKMAAASPVPIVFKVNQQNLGSIKNFEQAIRLCRGDIIVLSDQDDVWRGDKLQLIAAAFAGHPEVGLVFSDAEIVTEDLKPLGRRMWDEVGFDAHRRKLVQQKRALEVLISGWTVTGATMAFRSHFVNLSLPIPDGIAMIHDGWIALTIAAVADVTLIAEPLIRYRQHQKQQIGAPARRETTEERRGISALETALHRRNSSADLCKILETLEKRLSARASLYDGRKAMSFIADYAFHLNVRANLPPHRLRRLPGILRELWSRRYHEYANGFKSAAKDLVS